MRPAERMKRRVRPPVPKDVRSPLTPTEARLQQANAMSEKELQALIIELAELKGWLVYHTHDSRRSNPGFPDLCMVKWKRVVFAELKTQKGRRTPKQIVWGESLQLSDAEYYLWRPLDWLDRTVAKVI